METKTVTEIDYHEFEKLVIDKLRNGIDDTRIGREFSIVAMEEWNNDEEHSFNNIKKTDYPKKYHTDRDEMERFIETGEWSIYKPGVFTILEYLVYKEILPEGNYLISVCW